MAQELKVPQLEVPWGLHERLWPLKYVIFLGLFGISLYSRRHGRAASRGRAVQDRHHPEVRARLALRALRRGVAAAGAFIERFFCRYLCPLGAALAIPGRCACSSG